MADHWTGPDASPLPADGVSLLRQAESFVGLLFCWGIGITQLGMLVLLGVAPFLDPQDGPWWKPWTAVLSIPLVLVLLVVHLSGFGVVFRSLGSPRPLGVEAALRSPRWPMPVRPLAVLWWTFQFLVGGGIAFMMEMLSYVEPTPVRHAPMQTPPDTHVPPWFLLVVAFGMTFAGNTFLLQAVAVFTRRETVLRRIWGMRLLIDAIVVLVPAGLVYAGHRF